jgi:hypothetical protein
MDKAAWIVSTASRRVEVLASRHRMPAVVTRMKEGETRVEIAELRLIALLWW